MDNHGGYIVIDHYCKTNIIGGVWLGKWVDDINGYAQLKATYFILEFIGPCILYMLHAFWIR